MTKKIYFIADLSNETKLAITDDIKIGGYLRRHGLDKLPNVVILNYLDTCKAIETGSELVITTSIANLSFDLLDLGYQIFMVKNGKIVEIKPGMDNPANKDIRRENNVLRLFLARFFDTMFE